MLLWEVGIIGIILFIGTIASIPVAMRPKETFRATISSLRICNSLARHRRSMFCHRLSAQPAVQPDPDDHSHATVLLWLSLGALIVIHRAVRLNSGTHYE